MRTRHLHHSVHRIFSQLFAGFIAVCAIWLCSASAESDSLSEPKTKLDVVLLFDASGSMLKTDPKDLRLQGASLLFSFLREDDQLGIVSFSDTASVQRELQPFSPSRSQTILADIKNVQTIGRYTDIAAGISLSKALLATSNRPEAQQVIVLLSDGKNEPDPKNGPVFAATLQLVHDILPDLRSREVKVFTMALSDEADRAFLGEVSAATNGLTWFAKDAESIHKAYADLFLALKRPQIINQKGHDFLLEEEYPEVTFYINHGENETLTLVTPRGSALTEQNHPDYIVWHGAKKFDVITVKFPDRGTWQVVGTEENDGFAALLSELRVLTDWPISVHEDEATTVKARLYDSNKPIALPEMSQLVKVGFQITPMDKVAYPIMRKMLNDIGKDGDEVAGDGIFSFEMKVPAPGSYKMTVTAKAPTFQRSQQIPFVVRPRRLTLSVNAHGDKPSSHSSKHAHQDGEEGSSDSHFSVTLSKEVLTYKKLELFLHAKAHNGEHVKLPIVERGSLREYEVSAEGLPHVGAYTIYAALEARDKSGKRIEARSNEIHFTLNKLAAQPTVSHDKEQVPDEDDHISARESLKEILLPVALVTGANIVVVVVFVVFVSKKSKKKKGDIKRYIPNKQLIDAVATIQEATTYVDVDFNHPAFTTPVAGEQEIAEEEQVRDGDADGVEEETPLTSPGAQEDEGNVEETSAPKDLTQNSESVPEAGDEQKSQQEDE